MKKILIFIFMIFSLPLALQASEEELYFTYVGPVAEFGINRIAYKGWWQDTNTRRIFSSNGLFFGGGAMSNIYVRNFIGEFSMEYMNDYSGKEEISVQHMFFSTAFKYSFPLNNLIKISYPLALTTGPGLYLETSPASKAYKAGGGVNAIIGTIITIDREWKAVIDIVLRYGYFGLGDDSYKFSAGIKFGAVYKVGRI